METESTEELWCKECINSLEKLAKNGDKKAMFNLAKCYHGGNGTENNFEEAFHWYQKSSENGYTYAMFNLAICYTCKGSRCLFSICL
ncbi:hypothetical protein RhiirB3_440722 [Rhizophagus irregularis]|nr:hypothetical protein RhiirB3_440722 [Rhizophagus irregularis]